MSPVLKAGAVIISNHHPEKFGILYQKSHDDFTFPKGHLETGETLEQCAIREAREETGLNIRLIDTVGSFFYTNKKDGLIEITYFLAQSLNDTTIQTEPGGQFFWMSFDEAMEKLSYENLKELLVQAREKILK